MRSENGSGGWLTGGLATVFESLGTSAACKLGCTLLAKAGDGAL